MEERALKTEDDYQDEIDDLIKEIDRLYDEGTDKGFKLKREEEMEQEVRALETQKDYQNAVSEYMAKYEDQLSASYKIEREAKKLMAQAEKIRQDAEKNYFSKAKKLQSEAEGKGFDDIKLKRSEEADFATRKNSIIANLTDLETKKNEVLANI